MSDFFGIISLGQKPVEKEHLASMQKSLAIWEPDDTHQIYTSEAGMGQNTLWITPESKHETLPHKEQHLTIVANARIDNRDELIKQLSVKQTNSVITDTSLILAAYLKWGRDCAFRLIGEFAFVIWNEQDHTLFCAKDHVGTRPLYYATTNDYFLFSTEIRGIFATGLLPKELNELMAGVHLFSYSGELEQTIFKNVYKIPGAHTLTQKRGQRKETHHYWSPDIHNEIKLNSDQEYEEAFAELLRQAVRRRTRSDYPLGGLLSGGLDSTSVTGILLKENYHNTPLHLYSWAHSPGKKKDYPDDREFIDEFLKMHADARYSHQFLPGSDGYLSLIPEQQKLCDQPFKDIENHSRFENYEIAQQQNVRTLFNGTGGDELVTNQAFQYVAELFLNFRWLKTIQTLGAIRKSKNSTWKGVTYRNLALELFKLAKGEESWGRGHTFAGRDYYKKHRENVCIDQEFAESIKLNQFIRNHPSTQNLARFWKKPVKQSLMLNLTNSTFDLSFNQRYHVTQAYKMQYVYPLLDRDLLSFFMALPVDQLHKNGQGRSMIRRSMGQYVPASISNRHSKFTGTPYVVTRTIESMIWIKPLFAEWQKHSVISKVIDIKKMQEQIEASQKGDMGAFVYLIRAIHLCFFLHDRF